MKRIHEWFPMAIFAATLALGAGCKDDEAGGITAKVSEKNLCAEMAEIMCNNFFECCSGVEIEADFGISITTTEGECQKDAELMCEMDNAELLDSLRAGRITLNEENINACFDQHILPDDNCFPVVGSFAPACEEALITGNQRVDQACRYDFDCVGAAFCGTNRKCKAYPKEGDECDPRWGCAPGLFCRMDWETDTYLCEKRLPENEGCSNNYDCAENLICKLLEEPTAEGNAGICKPPKKLNETCEIDGDCASGYCLPAMCDDGIQPCWTNDDCRMSCDNSGILCGSDADCPGHCEDGTICMSCADDCERETCEERRCTGLGMCAQRFREVDYCEPNIVGVFGCMPGEFRCDNFRCIDGNFRCDGIFDCTDGTDESAAACGAAL